MFKSLLGAILGLLILSLTFHLPLAYADGEMLEISTTPPGATIWIDDVKVGISPGLFETSAGQHDIKATKPLYFKQSTKIQVEADEIKTINLDLQEDVTAIQRSKRTQLLTSFRKDLKKRSEALHLISLQEKKLKPRSTVVNGLSLKKNIEPKLKPKPSRSDHRKTKYEVRPEPAGIITGLALVSGGVCLVLFCFPKLWLKEKKRFDEKSFNRSLQEIEEYNRQAQARADEQNRDISAHNRKVGKLLDVKNKDVDIYNAGIRKKMDSIRRKYRLESLEDNIRSNAAQITSLCKKLGTPLSLPNRPDIDDYARAFKKLQ